LEQEQRKRQELSEKWQAELLEKRCIEEEKRIEDSKTDEDYYNALSVHPGTQGKLNGALYKQSGNSIPVPIFESIFRKILLGEVQEKEVDQIKF